jgi:hypothetical protein
MPSANTNDLDHSGGIPLLASDDESESTDHPERKRDP